MRYYKIINDDTFIGIITENDFRKYQHKNNILLVCNPKEAQYVRYNNILYRDKSWMNPVVTDKKQYMNVDIINITKDEYDMLYKAIENNEELNIVDEYDDKNIIEDIIEESSKLSNEDGATLNFIIDMKIKEMSKACNKSIIGGFDIVLTDGLIHHFSLSLEDQLNLLVASNKFNDNGEFLYHADNEPYKYYDKYDVKLIIDTVDEFKKFHTVYFNCLKMYIKSLTDIKVISEITYGIELPDDYRLDL